MAPPKTYKGGIEDVHFRVDFQRWKEFKNLWNKQEKSYTQRLNELIVQDLERNSIAENDMPGENVSCLGYTPKPVQQKIDDIQSVKNHQGIPILSGNSEIYRYIKSQDLQSAGEIEGRLKVWNTQVKNRLTELRQALAFANNPRVKRGLTR